MRVTTLLGFSIAAPLLALSLGGCVAVPVQPGYAADGPGVVYAGPPMVGYVWIDGYWDWSFGRRSWIGGHWGPPRGHGHGGRR